MSKSRLEKFLYALYYLDSSDLPTPLSRIEELYKCLVTGEEAPTFEPISRVEKYLMAILGVYDVDSLPNPLSRVEVLLYKLATGDDNLDDVKSFLSEHEELLAEIIRNGGVGGNIDIEYVLYVLSTEFNTLYNTAEKPVKSAILKGQTLVNLLSASNIKVSKSYHTIDYVHNLDTTKTYILKYRINQTPELNDVTDSGRLLKFEWYNGSVISGCRDIYNKDITVGRNNFIIINPYNDEVVKTNFSVWIPDYVSGNVDMDVMIIEYQEGMENWDIPYFEGMKSVQMPVLTTTGKNLLDVTILDEESEGSGWSYKRHGETMEFISDGAKAYQMYLKDITSDLISKLKVGKTYTLSSDITLLTEAKSAVQIMIIYVDGTYDYIESHANGSYSNEIKQKIKQIIFRLVGQNSSNASTSHLIIKNIQLEESSTPTTYEPYKSNILSTSEDVTLRGIGDVRDTLDCLTGEVIERIGEVVLDGSSDEKYTINGNTTSGGLTRFLVDNISNRKQKGNIISNLLPIVDNSNSYGIFNGVGLNIIVNCSTVDEFRVWLQQNPITIRYQLETESVKTVDLSVVDQDGDNTKLSTFDDLTHVTLSSEGLIPEAELEVATKNQEVLSTMSLEMNDISTTQNALQETSDIQSENVDATMVATTEIYEELL